MISTPSPITMEYHCFWSRTIKAITINYPRMTIIGITHQTPININ